MEIKTIKCRGPKEAENEQLYMVVNFKSLF